MFHWANSKKDKTQCFSEWRANRDCELFRMARKWKMLRTEKGEQKEDAALKERRANKDRDLFRLARE